MLLVFRDVLGISLPSYTEAYATTEDRPRTASLLSAYSAEWPWRSVRLGEEREFDVALFMRGGMQDHVGVVTGNGEMLHTFKGGEACIERFGPRCGRYREPRIYRHAEMMARHA